MILFAIAYPNPMIVSCRYTVLCRDDTYLCEVCGVVCCVLCGGASSGQGGAAQCSVVAPSQPQPTAEQQQLHNTSHSHSSDQTNTTTSSALATPVT